MRGNTARRAALILWVAFAFVIWNVVFDRKVYEAAVHFTQQQIARHQRGEAVTPIETAFTPEVRQAARSASLWASAVLGAGGLLLLLARRRS